MKILDDQQCRGGIDDGCGDIDAFRTPSMIVHLELNITEDKKGADRCVCSLFTAAVCVNAERWSVTGKSGTDALTLCDRESNIPQKSFLVSRSSSSDAVP